jgi:hypothetical protein
MDPDTDPGGPKTYGSDGSDPQHSLPVIEVADKDGMVRKVGRQVQILAVLAQGDLLRPLEVYLLEGVGGVLRGVHQVAAREAQPRLHPFT